MRGAGTEMHLIGLPLSFALALAIVPAGVRGLARPGLVRENYRGRRLAFPLGAVLVVASLVALAPLAVLDDRADLDLLDPELRRWFAYVLGVAFLGLLDDALGRGCASARRAAGAATRGRSCEGRLSTGAIKAIGALALAAYATSGRGLQAFDYLADLALLLLATNIFNLARPAARAGGEGAAAARGRALPRSLDGRRRCELLGALRRPGAGRRLVHAARAGDARRHRLEPGRGDRRDLAAETPRETGRLIALGVVVGIDHLRGISFDLRTRSSGFRCFDL